MSLKLFHWETGDSDWDSKTGAAKAETTARAKTGREYIIFEVRGGEKDCEGENEPFGACSYTVPRRMEIFTTVPSQVRAFGASAG